MSSPSSFSSLRGQLPVLRIDGGDSVIEATVHGAHLLEWNPVGTRPVLFMSPRSVFESGKPIRGGVPICFPWFGPKADDPKAPPHGFVRTLDWTVKEAAVAPQDTARLVFSLMDNPTMRATWPHPFEAEFSIEAGKELTLALVVRNTGEAPLTFTAALHTYLAVSDVREISVRGLENTDYIDRVGGAWIPRKGESAPVAITAETDRIYTETTATCIVDDPQWKRRIHVAKSGSRSTVVWSPWTAKAASLPDLGADAWTGFVCVETCNAADDSVTLSPGSSHRLEARLSVDQE